MTLHARRVPRVSRQLDAAQRERTEEATLRVWKKAQDVRTWHTTLNDMSWDAPSTLEYIQRLSKATIKEDEQNRLVAWQDKMDWCDKDAINWVKEGDDVIQEG